MVAQIVVTATLIFVFTYLLIVTEVVHRTVAAMLGAILMFVFQVIPYVEILGFIDFQTIGVALGMMIFIATVRRSGFFQFLSIRFVKMTGGDPLLLVFALSGMTVLFSTFFSNVTTILIVGSLSVAISKEFDLDFVPLLVMVALMSNVGGLTTVVSSLPNIMVGSAANVGFVDFFVNVAPASVFMIALGIAYFRWMYGKTLSKYDTKLDPDVIEELDEWSVVPDRQVFWRSIVMLGLIVVLYTTQDITGLTNDVVALSVATLMLIFSGDEPEEILKDVQWSTLFFFAGLFVVVGGVETVGLLEEVARTVAEFTGDNPAIVFLSVMWVSAVLSGVIDNIPVTAVLIPVVQNLNAVTGVSIGPMWWSLVLGANLGGNVTPIASAAGVLVLGLVEKHGRSISFGEFVKVGSTLTLGHLLIATAYVFLRFVWFV